jgi:hypothetical protein
MSRASVRIDGIQTGVLVLRGWVSSNLGTGNRAWYLAAAYTRKLRLLSDEHSFQFALESTHLSNEVATK